MIGKKTFRIIMVIVLLGGSFWGYTYYTKGSSKPNQSIVTAQVQTGSIENTIKTTGTSSLVDEQEMKFNQDGKVTAVYVKAGDTVKKGDVIAQLDTADLQSSIQQAEISLNNSKIQLQQKLEPASSTDLLSTKNSIDSSQKNLSIYNEQLTNLTNERDNKLADAQKEIDSAQADLENLTRERDNKLTDYESQIAAKQDSISSKQAQLAIYKSDLETLKKQENKSISDLNISNNTTISNAYTDAKKYFIDIDNLLLQVDKIFGITDDNKTKNDSYETYLSAKNSGLKISTENAYGKTTALLTQARTYYDSLSNDTPTAENIKTLLDKIGAVYDSMITLGKTASESVQSSIATNELPQSTIDSYYNSMLSVSTSSKSSYDNIKSTILNINKLSDTDLQQEQSNSTISQKQLTINDAQSSLNQLVSDLTSLKNTVELTKKTYENNIKQKTSDIESKKKSLELSKNTYATSLQQKQNDISNEQKNLAVLQEKLKDLQDGTDAEEIQLAKNDIAKQEISLISTKKNLDKYQLTAPFDGVIRKIDFKVGDNILGTDSKYVYIENPNLVQITADIDQIDIVNVKLGQKVKIVFDSYQAKEFTGVISEKDSTPVTSNGVTSYTVTVTLDKGNDDIYSGMTAKLYIVVDSKSNIMTIPSSFIETSGDKSFVTVKNGERNERKEVVTGITDSTNTEIISGLNIGNTVVRTINISTSTSSSSSSSSSRSSNQGGGNGGGGFGGPPPGM